jgi:transcriptional regulator with XRE-family HTH domain
MTKKPWNAEKSVGEKIKERREQLGLTRIELAKRIKVQQQRITELEATSKRPSAEKLLQISDVLDTPMLYFLTDCELNDVDEEVLLVKYRKLTPEKKKLGIKIIKILMTPE